jgi:hypothetical protein
MAAGYPSVFLALQQLNAWGITAFNHLAVTRFALDDAAKAFLTSSYSYTLATNFGPHSDYIKDIRNAKGPIQVVIGADDELFDAQRYAGVFADAGKSVAVTLVPSINHMGITLEKAAHTAIATACKL